MIRRDKMIG